MEQEAVLASRFDWDPSRPAANHALLYEMLVVRRGEEIVGLRDHTVIVPVSSDPLEAASPVIVHLSHNLVEQPLRGSGLAGWLRALPLQTARECAARAGVGRARPITLVAEMEAYDERSAANVARLRSYGRAGFQTLEPETVDYHQPDLRSAEEIDRDALRSIPLTLAVRRVGREAETSLAASEARGIIRGLYTMFGLHVRSDHMQPLWRRLERLPDDAEKIDLVSPHPT